MIAGVRRLFKFDYKLRERRAVKRVTRKKHFDQCDFCMYRDAKFVVEVREDDGLRKIVLCAQCVKVVDESLFYKQDEERTSRYEIKELMR